MQDLAKASREIVPELRDDQQRNRRAGQGRPRDRAELRRTNDEIQITARNWGKLGERLDVLLQTNQDKIIKSLDNLNDTLVRVSNTFSDDNQRNLAATLKNVRAGSENLEAMTKNADEMVKESRQTIQRVNESITQTNEVLGNLQQATKPMAERSASVMKNLDESTEKFNRTLTDVREVLRGAQPDRTARCAASSPTRRFTITSTTPPA